MTLPAVNHDRLIKTLIELCSIPSPSGRESALRNYTQKKLTSLGFETSLDDFGNLYTSTEETSHDNIFLSCHMDTVPLPAGENIFVIRENGRISSGGNTILGGDDKQGIAAALEMMELCREFPERHRGLDVLFTVQEELGSLGGAALEPQRLRARDGFNLDGETEAGTVIYKAPEKARFKCSIKGKSAHAALNPEEGINAVVIAATIISRLPIGVPGPESTSNIGSISGGAQSNVVPDYAEFFGELRSFSPEEFNSIKSDINDICRDTAQNLGGIAEITWESVYSGFNVSRNTASSQWFVEACNRKGYKPVFLSSRGGGDSNQLNSMGLSNLVFGLGMNNIHSNKEFIVESEYLDAVELLKTIIFPEK